MLAELPVKSELRSYGGLQFPDSLSAVILGILCDPSQISESEESFSFSGQLWVVFELEACLCIDTAVCDGDDIRDCQATRTVGKKETGGLGQTVSSPPLND